MHPVDQEDLALQVRRPPPTSTENPDFAFRSFTNRVAANNALQQSQDNWTCVSLLFEDLLHDYERKVDGVNELRLGAQPSNAVALGVDKKVAALARVERHPVRSDIKFMMDLHRAQARNNGFFEVLVPKKDDEELDDLSAAMVRANLEDDDERQLRSLPILDFLDFADAKVDALLEEALPSDRQRLRAHLSKVALGKVFGTAPTNVATDSLASRLDLISRNVTDRLNAKRDKDNTGVRRLLVVRAFKLDDEHAAFINLLRDPTLRDKAAPQHKWGPESRWTLHLSLAYWLLMCLRSPVVRHIDDDDSLNPHKYVWSRIENLPLCARLLAAARQEISWQEYESGAMIEKAVIIDMFLTILKYGVERTDGPGHYSGRGRQCLPA